MNSEDKTKEQLIEESGKMSQQITELETLETERKKTEEELREARGYLENLINYANAPIIVWDKEFRITRFNHAFEHLTGYTTDETTGQELRMLFPEASRDESLGKIERTLSGEYWKSVEIPILCKDGNIKLALWNSANIYARDGTTLLATIAQGMDISERKKAEERIRKFSSAVEQSIDGIAMCDLEPKLTYVNDAFARMHGYSPGEMMGMKVVNLHNEEQMDEYNRGIEQVKTEGSWIGEIGHIRKDGTPFLTHMSVTLLKDIEGKPTGILAVARDITEHKKAEEELRKRTHDLGERVKELNCLFGISQLVEKAGISLMEIFQRTIGLIPPSGQYPEITCARIILEGQEFKTENFRETIWKQASDIIVHGKPIGSIEVCLLEERPESDERPFLKEERNLLNAISGRLGRIIERKRGEEALKEYQKAVESSQEMIAVLDCQYVYCLANEAFMRYRGLNRDQVVGHTVTELLGEDAFETKVKPNFDRCLGGENVRFEIGRASCRERV